ncbi:ABC transporter substrate-binding protein [Paenibacillus sepulcri]|uniref:ABC transporter substrate-binding protein n=1 Tax=Paenibacillus sepulcri TaxID=359917 RepID=A0ABS7CAA4_9BACL|nr:ABC transporter substrate-binding protein [Paenibacillus sepulcri]
MRKSIKLSFTIIAVLILALTAAACGQEDEADPASNLANTTNTTAAAAPVQDLSPTKEEIAADGQSTVFYTFQDDADKTVTLTAKPERIIVLAPEFLPVLYELGGKAVGRITVNASPVPEAAEDIQQLGTVGQVNVEQLVALKPDLVIGSTTFDAKLTDLMASNKIPLALLKMSSFESVKEKAELFGIITGNETKAGELIAKIEADMAGISSKIPADQHPTFTVLNVTPSSISLQRSNTTALEIGHLLGMTNIAEGMSASPNSATSAPYSMEALVAAQPDFIFMTIHGAQDKGMAKIQQDLEKNPAWASLTAVKEKRAMVIPADKFLTNPGFNYAESMKLMAQIVYPEIFG